MPSKHKIQREEAAFLENNIMKMDERQQSSRCHRRAQFDSNMDSNNSGGEGAGSSSSPRGSRLFLYFTACLCNVAAFSAGAALGWSSPEIPRLKAEGRPLTAAEEGWLGSLLPVGAVVGPAAAALAADRLGRRPALLAGGAPFAAAFALCAAAGGRVPLLLAARFLMGVGAGAVFTLCPMYVAEVADDGVRGALGACFQLSVTLGILFSYCLGPFVSVAAFNAANVAPPAAFLLAFGLLAPESPHHLLRRGDRPAAERALLRLRGAAAPADVQKELAAVEDAAAAAAAAGGRGLLDACASRGLRRALGLSVALVAFQQLSGINVVLFYAQDIFEDAGVPLSPAVCAIVLGAVQVGASCLCPTLIERSGKRFLLLASCLGSAAAEAALVYFFYAKEERRADVAHLAWLPVAAVVAYVVFFNVGLAPIPWAAMGELFPAHVKAAASCCTATACWALAFLLTRYFGAVADVLGKAASFGVFSGCCVAGAAFVYKCLPETSGKSLQEIQDMLNGSGGKEAADVKA